MGQPAPTQKVATKSELVPLPPTVPLSIAFGRNWVKILCQALDPIGSVER